jgi:hypothetical protein
MDAVIYLLTLTNSVAAALNQLLRLWRWWPKSAPRKASKPKQSREAMKVRGSLAARRTRFAADHARNDRPRTSKKAKARR